MCSRPVTDFYYDREEMLSRPEVALERARAAGDVVWSQPMRRWIVVSHAAAQEALREPDLEVYDLFRVFDGVEARVGADLSSLRRICGWIPFLLDGPRHAVLRQVFARLMAALRGPYLATCEEASRDLLDAMGSREDADYARDYAERLHVEVLGRIIGLTGEDRHWIAQVSSSQGSIDFAASVSEMVDANGRAQALLDRLALLTEGLPFMDWLGGQLAAAGMADTGTSRLECLTGFLLLGRDTIGGTLTLGLAQLIDAAGGHLRPADLPEGSLIVDEVIRLSSTVQIAIRAARRDLTLAGQQIARGEMLMIFLPAANRDPSAFACPHDLRAGQPAHLAFGSGRHLCVGMPLSRQVVAMALDHLKRFDYIGAAPGRRFDESRNTRKYLHLPIRSRQHHDA